MLDFMLRPHLVRSFSIGVAILAVVGLAEMKSSGQEAEKEIPKATKSNKYLGAKRCKLCHSEDSAGNPHKKWAESKHRNAYAQLATAASKKLAQKLGIDDPQKSPKCLRCHVTGFGEPPEVFSRSFEIDQGVQCETCHGPGEQHFEKRLAAVSERKKGAEDAEAYQSLPAGEIIARPSVASCLACHSEASPTFQGFCFKKGATEILHHDPRKTRTKDELAALKCDCGDKCSCRTAECGGWPSGPVPAKP